jgi:hypothetical protein
VVDLQLPIKRSRLSLEVIHADIPDHLSTRQFVTTLLHTKSFATVSDCLTSIFVGVGFETYFVGCVSPLHARNVWPLKP